MTRTINAAFGPTRITAGIDVFTPTAAMTHRCHIFETGDDRLSSKASSATAAQSRPETNRALIQA
ncbi:MAG: hypothetical protein O9248_00455 [Rhodobacteraceae bacterium]|nr:hypothetical protein [Paracoccaceae bacterium]